MRWMIGLVFAVMVMSFAHAQTNPGFIDGATLCANYPNPACQSVTPTNPLSLNQAFMNKADVGSISGCPTLATPCTWTAVTSFIGNNTAPIPNVSAGRVIVQNSSLTKDQIYDPTTAVTVKTNDGVQSTGFLPAGSTIGSINGFGAYLRNEATSAGGGGVGFYALVTCGATGTSCWGENYRVLDCENAVSCAASLNINLVAGEDDFYVGNTCPAGVTGPCPSGGNSPTSVGARSVILSTFMDRQPNFAFGWSCSNVSTINGPDPPFWNSCVSSLNGAAAVALNIGTLKHIPAGGRPNVASQSIALAFTDSAGAVQAWQMFVDTAGTFEFTSTKANPTLFLNGEFASSSLLVGKSGVPVFEAGLIGTNVSFPQLTGAAGYACLDVNGLMYKKATCP